MSTSSVPPPNAQTMPLVDLVVNTVTSCHTESTPETVSLQIVKALLALVLSPTILVHQSSLLKAVRTVNVFLLSVDPINQTVAQGGLTQMVNHVFARCKVDGASLSRSESSTTLASRRADLRLRTSTTNSPASIPTPLTPAGTIDGQYAAESTEAASTLVNGNGSKVSLPMDTPSVASVDLPPDEHLEEQQDSSGSSRPSLASHRRR